MKIEVKFGVQTWKTPVWRGEGQQQGVVGDSLSSCHARQHTLQFHHASYFWMEWSCGYDECTAWTGNSPDKIVNMFTSDEKVHQHTWLIPLHFNNPSTNTINRVIIKNIELALQYLKFPCLDKSEVLCLSSDPNLVVQTFRKKILQHRIIDTFQYAMQLRKNVWWHKYQKPSSVLKAFRAWGVIKGCSVCCSGWARYMQL